MSDGDGSIDWLGAEDSSGSDGVSTPGAVVPGVEVEPAGEQAASVAPSATRSRIRFIECTSSIFTTSGHP